MTQRVLIGIDAGGTKTEGVAAVLGAEGAGPVLVRERTGGTNPHSVPAGTLEARHVELRDRLLASLAEESTVAAVCLASAGVDRPDDAARLSQLLGRTYPGIPVLVVNDAVAALAGAIGKLEGILVISGTGSICIGASGTRDSVIRCGGWGHILDDAGSGYWLGLDGLREVVRSADGRQAETRLSVIILDALTLSKPTDLIGWLLGNGADKAAIAALSRHVLVAAAEGDAAAARVAERNARALVDLVAAVRRRLARPPGVRVPLVLFGGNLTHSAHYRALFLGMLEAAQLEVEIVAAKAGAPEGALLLAAQFLREGAPRQFA